MNTFNDEARTEYATRVQARSDVVVKDHKGRSETDHSVKLSESLVGLETAIDELFAHLDLLSVRLTPITATGVDRVEDRASISSDNDSEVVRHLIQTTDRVRNRDALVTELLWLLQL